MSPTAFPQLAGLSDFINRHLGPADADQQAMLASFGEPDLASFIERVIPASIRMEAPLQLAAPNSEAAVLEELKQLADQNLVLKSLIGQGYYGTLTPNVILRNVLENPAWYTAYTPYQPEISQGRLEALLNFQTAVADLTGMDIANASMLDEGTACAEAMTLAQRVSKSKVNAFFVDADCLPQTIEVVQTRAEPLGIEVIIGNPFTDLAQAEVFGALLQYPGASGEVRDFTDVIAQLQARQGIAIVAADLLALSLLKSPGAMGADVAVGSSQRLGVPLGFGGPHAGYLATRDSHKRSMPGRLVGVSQDSRGQYALRLALQTREQHIRREKATSNICTAQVLLAVIASLYCCYHGGEGLKRIATRIARYTQTLRRGIEAAGLSVVNPNQFDTLTIASGAQTAALHQAAIDAGYNLRRIDSETLGLSLDETITEADLQQLLALFGQSRAAAELDDGSHGLPEALTRSEPVLAHPVFNRYHSETEMLRYLRKLADKDIALDRAMIPLGSCTMKLNATAEMIPITWPQFANLHPFAPAEQTVGMRRMIEELEQMLCEATGYAGISLQPNAGSQGEYAGLLAIRAYHASRGESQRNICLIPSSAHGTNPASAQMCGMPVVVVKCDANGNVDLQDLRAKAEQYSDKLAAIMITYPSTHGVFEAHVRDVCEVVHQHGGQVYIDGANFNAMVGLCQPGKFGGDVSHLNLHKTFCIPHGGGGPGVGPVAVGEHLIPFLPGHSVLPGEHTVGAVSAAPYGSALILPISWVYMKLMGSFGLQRATEVAILNANYIAKRLAPHYPVLYTGANGYVAHECIIDLRALKDESGISVEDVAKRLIDFGFHAPTMSFPVAGTLMIEPTESESKVELDRFCDAMIQIRHEIARVQAGEWPLEDNPLVNAPHTADVVSADEWNHAYPRSLAAYPLASLRECKYWVPVGRVDNVYGDRNLVCSCLPIEAYME